MIIQILISFVAFAVAVFVLVSIQKPEFRVARSTMINAPANIVFAEINNFYNWLGWSPWAKMDPAAISIFEGPDSGVGAVYKWEGNKKVGSGMMLIEESRAGEYIKIRIQFFKPFKAINSVEFIFKEQEGQTALTWSMSGKNNFIGKAMSLVFNCDKMVGGSFEQGLAAIKTISEGKK